MGADPRSIPYGVDRLNTQEHPTPIDLCNRCRNAIVYRCEVDLPFTSGFDYNIRVNIWQDTRTHDKYRNKAFLHLK
ncbi:unnamed protein product [Lepeophtheirus salmonis]|uniref:(salmon louse) hypothetical protein n=1 Tax=Lepeophtheirus salmonis TaxID=72036 RepID=A0A7R8H7Y4_LEPSM|nr:unnamed protein product [Lepeophtheirus salmonis]CAF2927641.1 unnamed protein product [Lepeophtheirus salmonis]